MVYNTLAGGTVIGPPAQRVLARIRSVVSAG